MTAEELIPQLKQVARRIVRKAGYLHDAADEAERAAAADATASVMAKVAEVLADFESGARRRPATNMSGYLYRAMERALVDWQRQLPKERAARLTQDEYVEHEAWLNDRVITRDDKRRDEAADEPLGGFRAFRVRASLPPPRLKRTPFLLRLFAIAGDDWEKRWWEEQEEASELQRKPLVVERYPWELAVCQALDDVSCQSRRAPPAGRRIGTTRPTSAPRLAPTAPSLSPGEYWTRPTSASANCHRETARAGASTSRACERPRLPAASGFAGRSDKTIGQSMRPVGLRPPGP